MILGFFSKDHVDWRVSGGRTNDSKNYQIFFHVTDSEIPTLVETWLRGSRHTPFVPGTHKLVLQSRNDFWNFSVGERGLMVILSSDITIDVRNITAGDNTTLIFGQMSIESIQKIAQVCGISMDSHCSGVYKFE
jgi:hypothetical protein